jgi:hypothetical protein
MGEAFHAQELRIGCVHLPNVVECLAEPDVVSGSLFDECRNGFGVGAEGGPR